MVTTFLSDSYADNTRVTKYDPDACVFFIFYGKVTKCPLYRDNTRVSQNDPYDRRPRDDEDRIELFIQQ